MAYVIAEPCIGTKDTACVDACPVDCIHPKKDEPNHAEAEMLYIDPVECIDCGACVPVCSLSTIFRRSGRTSRRRTLLTTGSNSPSFSFTTQVTPRVSSRGVICFWGA